ncbi:MAG: hypothetical protein KBS59_04340, partial [Clostridiales bacterium]|nr:hypothetical protein [Clostridiales bacterium]
STGNGGGIYNEDVLGLEIVEISGCKAGAGKLGGGIYSGSTSHIFAGKTAKVKNNTSGDTTPNNIYHCIGENSFIKLGTGEDVHAPQAGMELHITTSVKPTFDTSITITLNGKEADTVYFVSDDADCLVEYDMLNSNIMLIANTKTLTIDNIDPFHPSNTRDRP